MQISLEEMIGILLENSIMTSDLHLSFYFLVLTTSRIFGWIYTLIGSVGSLRRLFICDFSPTISAQLHSLNMLPEVTSFASKETIIDIFLIVYGGILAFGAIMCSLMVIILYRGRKITSQVFCFFYIFTSLQLCFSGHSSALFKVYCLSTLFHYSYKLENLFLINNYEENWNYILDRCCLPVDDHGWLGNRFYWPFKIK